MAKAINVEDYRNLARKRLPRAVFDLVDGGAEDEITLVRNRQAFRDSALVPRVLVDVSKRDQSTEICGARISLPIALAPTSVCQACWPNGDVLAAQAAAKSGTIFSTSLYAGASLEAIAEGSKGTLWFQLYMWKDRSLVRSIIERAKEAGYSALIFTVDTAIVGARERDIRNSLVLPPRITIRNALESLRHPGWVLRWLVSPKYTMGSLVSTPQMKDADFSSLRDLIARNRDESVTWKDLEWVRSVFPGPIIVKGILSPEDARIAAESGASGIVVSNHGGRQLDSSISTIEALPAVVDAVAGRSEILLDSGIFRGTDVIKALALGARAVMVGKPYLYGLAARGGIGVEQVIKIFQQEIDRAMALVGVQSLSELKPSHVASKRFALGPD